MKKFYEFKKSDNGATELYVYGDITSLQFCESDVTAFDFANELNECDGDITVRINSYGGEVSQGLSMYNLLKHYSKGIVTTVCDGFACSAASVVFMAGEKRIMPTSSLLLIHNAWSSAEGNANDFRKTADDLEKVTQPSIEIYKENSNLSEEEIKGMMDAETWITANEALKYGFATDVQHETQHQSIENNLMQKLVFANKELKAELNVYAQRESDSQQSSNVIDYDRIRDIVKEALASEESPVTTEEPVDEKEETEEQTAAEATVEETVVAKETERAVKHEHTEDAWNAYFGK